MSVRYASASGFDALDRERELVARAQAARWALGWPRNPYAGPHPAIEPTKVPPAPVDAALIARLTERVRP